MRNWLFVVVVVCLFASNATPQGAGDKKGTAGKPAQKHTADGGLLESLPTSEGGKGGKPADAEIAKAGYLWYNNWSVVHPGGATCNGSEGATQISVFASDVAWRYANQGGRVESPTGTGGPAGNGWQYPNANRFGVVVRQGNNYWNVTSTDPNNPTVITGLSNTVPVIVGVNDTVGNYADNWGSFDIHIRKDN